MYCMSVECGEGYPSFCTSTRCGEGYPTELSFHHYLLSQAGRVYRVSQPRDTWEEGPSVEELPRSDWLLAIPMRLS